MNKETLECIKSVRYSYYLIKNNIKKECIFNDFEEQEMSEKRDTKDGNKCCEKEVLILWVIKNTK